MKSKFTRILGVGLTITLLTSLMIAVSPAIINAAEGGVTGQGKGGNTAPTVTGVTLVEAGSDTAVTAMTPLTTYRVKATVGDVNTINDIQTVEFHLYYTTDGTQWDGDSVAIFKWTKSTGSWTMENGSATTTWSVVTGSSSLPGDLTVSSGDWYLGFKPGKLAQADAVANWKASVKASDENKNSGFVASAAGASMGAYSEISFSNSTVTFGDAANGIEPGDRGYIDISGTRYLTSRVTSNGQYSLGMKASSPWTDGGTNTITLVGGTGVPTGNARFNLAIDDAVQGGSQGEPAVAQAVTTNTTTIAGHATDARVNTSINTSEGTSDTNLYMALSLSLTGIAEVTYSGTITFTVTN